MSEVNSHIQITKALLRKFSHKTVETNEFGTNTVDKVYYLDLTDNKIKEEKINILGTEKGYYSDEVERFLCDDVESKLGEIIKIASEFQRGKSNLFILSPKHKINIVNFFRFCLIRNENLIKEVNRNSVFSQLVGGYTKNYLLSNINLVDVELLFNGYFPNLLINTSNVELVIPRNCFYSAMVKGKPTRYIMPINPKVALVLINETERFNLVKDGKLLYLQIDQDKILKCFNQRALFDEKIYNNSFVVANRKDELEDLQI
jgi:hypothetical protein